MLYRVAIEFETDEHSNMEAVMNIIQDALPYMVDNLVSSCREVPPTPAEVKSSRYMD